MPPNKDIPAINAILIAGIVYLMLRAKAHRSFLGIDLTSPDGWKGIEQAVGAMIRATVDDE